jgi:hypothetical protein
MITALKKDNHSRSLHISLGPIEIMINQNQELNIDNV